MWYKAESGERPTAIDTKSSKYYNYIRKNVVEGSRDGEPFYQYEELKIKKDEWGFFEVTQELHEDNETLNDTMLAIIEMLEGGE